MEFLGGNPTILVISGVIVTIILAILYFHSQDRRVLPFLGIGVLMILVPILLDYAIETKRETLVKTVKQLARHVRQNDVPGSLEFFHPGGELVRNRMQREMPQYDFSLCNVTGIRGVKFNNDEQTEATVKFVVAYNLEVQGHREIGFRGVTLEFRLSPDKDRWLITNYRHYMPISTGQGGTDGSR